MPVPSNWHQKLTDYVEKWKTESAHIPGGTQGEFLGDRPFPNFVLTEEVPATSWSDFLQWKNEFKGSWAFRGQGKSSWNIDTSLDRAVMVEYSGDGFSGYERLDRETELKRLLFLFQQQAHHYIDNLPELDDIGSWLALMQHYGVPTRFLDWTKSPYVALYFALADDPSKIGSPETNAAVWAIDLDWLETRGQELLRSDYPIPAFDDYQARAKYLNRLLPTPTEKAVIVKVDPIKSNERMVAQQGFFLCNLFHKQFASFSQILMSMMFHQIPAQPVVRKLQVDMNQRIPILKQLQEINIHNASLFPGLDGFGKSLKLDLQMKAVDKGRTLAEQIANDRMNWPNI